MRIELGKITNVTFGNGGYQDCQFGIWFTLGGDHWGVSDGKGWWNPATLKWDKGTKWTETERSKGLDEIMRYIAELMKQAKVDSLHKLKGIPIECQFDGNTLKSWRILSEVL